MEEFLYWQQVDEFVMSNDISDLWEYFLDDEIEDSMYVYEYEETAKDKLKGAAIGIAAGTAGGTAAVAGTGHLLRKKTAELKGAAGIRARGAMRAREHLKDFELRKLWKMAKKAPKASLVGIGLGVALTSLVWNFGESVAMGIVNLFKSLDKKEYELKEKLKNEDNPKKREKIQEDLDKIKEKKERAKAKLQSKVENGNPEKEKLSDKEQQIEKLKARIAAGKIAKKANQ